MIHLSWLWKFKRNIFEGERGAFGLEDRDLVFFGKVLSHCVVVVRRDEADQRQNNVTMTFLSIQSAGTEVLILMRQVGWAGQCSEIMMQVCGRSRVPIWAFLRSEIDASVEAVVKHDCWDSTQLCILPVHYR